MYPQFIDVVIFARKIPCKLPVEESCLFFLNLTKNARDVSGFVVLYQTILNVVFLMLGVGKRHTCTKRKVELNVLYVKPMCYFPSYE